MLVVTPKKGEESAKEYVRRQMMNNIISLDLQPGQQLNADELCALFNVSRNPVREAELDLQQTGLVEIRPKVGAFVSKIDPELIAGIRSMRTLIERELAVEACGLRTDEQIASLRKNIRNSRRCFGSDIGGTFHFDKEFHTMFFKICHREVWSEMVSGFQPHYDRIMMMQYKVGKDDRFIDAHSRLTDAVEKRDRKAAAEAVTGNMSDYARNVTRLYDEYADYFTVGVDECREKMNQA